MRHQSFTTKSYQFINYSEMSDSDSKSVWEIRNDIFISAWMVNDKAISYKEHTEFIDSLRHNLDKDYYVVKDFDNNIIGSVNITYTDLGISERGIYINPDFWGKGHAYACLVEFYRSLVR